MLIHILIAKARHIINPDIEGKNLTFFLREVFMIEKRKPILSEIANNISKYQFHLAELPLNTYNEARNMLNM